MCEMKEDEKEVVILDKGIDDAFSVDMACCPGGNGLASR